LKERHTKRALEHWFERRVGIRDFLFSLLPHVRVHHLSDEWAGPDDWT